MQRRQREKQQYHHSRILRIDIMRRKNINIAIFIFFEGILLVFSGHHHLYAQNKSKENSLHSTSIFSPFKKFSGATEVDLDKGKNIVTMFSLDCEDCMETAKQIGEISKEIKLPSTYFLFLGTEEQIEDFFAEAQCRYPYIILDPSTFFSIIDAPYPPRVCLLTEGKITADFKAGNEFTKEKLKNALTH
jgi:hypothetical protein